jgi:hypothetical protein
VIAEPHVEAGIVEAGHLEIDLAVIEALKDAHGHLFLADEKPTAVMLVKIERRDGYGLRRLAIRRRDDAKDMGARPHNGDAPAELGRGSGFVLGDMSPEVGSELPESKFSGPQGQSPESSPDDREPMPK